MDDWENYSMIDDEESIPPCHGSQGDTNPSAGSTQFLDDAEAHAPTSDSNAQTADKNLLPVPNSPPTIDDWHVSSACKNPTMSHPPEPEHVYIEGLLPVLDGFAKVFKETKEVNPSDPEYSVNDLSKADRFASISEFQTLVSQVNNNSLSLKELEKNTVYVSQIAQPQSAVQNHAECLNKGISKTEIPSLWHTMESLSVELQQEKHRSNANIRTLDALEQNVAITRDEVYGLE